MPHLFFWNKILDVIKVTILNSVPNTLPYFLKIFHFRQQYMLQHREIQMSILLKISSPYSFRHFKSYYMAATVPAKEKGERLKEGMRKSSLKILQWNQEIRATGKWHCCNCKQGWSLDDLDNAAVRIPTGDSTLKLGNLSRA